MNRRTRRAYLAMGVDVTKKTEKVETYDGDSVEAALTVVERFVEGPELPPRKDPRPIARPGQSAKLRIYKDPNHVPTEEQPDAPNIRAYRRHVHSVMYIGTAGIREYMPLPPTASALECAQYEARFQAMAEAENLRLLTRQEKRNMWREEQKRLAERRKRQKAEVARILAENSQ